MDSERSIVTDILQIIGWLEVIGGIIAAIATGITLHSVVLGLIIGVSSVTSGFLLLGFVEVVNSLQNISYTQRKILSAIEDKPVEKSQTSEATKINNDVKDIEANLPNI